MKKTALAVSFVLFSYIPFIDKVEYKMEGEILDVQIKQNMITYLWKQDDGVEVFESKSLFSNPDLYYLRKGAILTETRISKQSLFGKGLELILGTTTEIFDKPTKTKYEVKGKTLDNYNYELKST